MTTVNEHVLTESEINLRNALDFLKGCHVQYSINEGNKYSTTKEKREHFLKGSEVSKPIEKTYNVWDFETKSQIKKVYKVWPSSHWTTICHIIHNRLRHERPHTGSYESDQKFLTDFKEDRWHNSRYVKEFQKNLLEDYKIKVPGLE